MDVQESEDVMSLKLETMNPVNISRTVTTEPVVSIRSVPFYRYQWKVFSGGIFSRRPKLQTLKQFIGSSVFVINLGIIVVFSCISW